MGGAPKLAAMFSQQKSVQERLTPVLQIYAVALLGYFLNLVLSAALRALGRPTVTCLAFLVFYYPVMLPLAYLLGFPRRLGLLGMYSAYAIGVMGVMATEALVMSRISFERTVQDCRDQQSVADELKTSEHAAELPIRLSAGPLVSSP